ncbi:hypothetical protein V6N12_013654 [Hibiscus sabdariffa]|uniref:Uncharacterized protein n=1 Tax=Hibiscus sabdariffa TaxID=183260 RepID=A0ABR1Z5X6_9ROSI
MASTPMFCQPYLPNGFGALNPAYYLQAVSGFTCRKKVHASSAIPEAIAFVVKHGTRMRAEDFAQVGTAINDNEDKP